MYSMSECCTVCKVVIALNKLLDEFVVFPGHLLMLAIKEGFYVFIGSINNSRHDEIL